MSEPTVAETAASSRRTSVGLTGRLAMLVIAIALLAAILAPWLAPHDPNEGSLLDAFSPPSGSHPLGTDATGRDILSRLLYGARTSLVGPAAIVILSFLISVPLALVAAWRGGTVAFLITRTLDVVFAVPGLLLAILAVSLFGPGLGAAVTALAIAYVPFVARIAVTSADAERRLPYVSVLSIQGHGFIRIAGLHMLRNISPVLIGQATVAFAYALIDLASLSFLGLAVQAPQSDWGVMVSDRDSVLQGHPLQVVVASMAIVLTVLSLFVLGSRLSGESTVGRRRRTRRPRS